jgi:tetratricopeptide (TPR) repeat protein
MRRLLVVLFPLVAATSTAFAGDLLGPADYLKILIDSKLHYKILSEPSKTPEKQMTCDRRTYSTRLVTKGNSKSLVEWTVKPEAAKLLDEAETLYQAEKIDEAGAKYKAAAEADPEAVSAVLFYGDTLLMGSTKDAAAALVQYRKGIALDPTLPMAHFFAATALAELGRHDEAREEIIKALTYHPAYEAVWKIAASVPERWNARPVVRYKFEPPAGFLGVKGKDGSIDVYGGAKGEWLGYALCKAVWANEARFSKQHSTDGWSIEEEHACVGNELLGRLNTAESTLIEQQKKNGVAKPVVTEAEVIAAMSPLGRHLDEVVKAGLLDGYILFEIVGQRCPLAMSMTNDDGLKEIDRYIRKYVIVAKE